MKLTTALLVALSLSVAVTPAPAARQSSGGDWKRCGRIGFERASDNIATNIRARGTRCKSARKVVRAVHAKGVKNPYGYRCKRRALGGALPSWGWTCSKNDRRVKWRKT